MSIRRVLKYPNILLGGFFALMTLSIMKSAYSNILESIKIDLSLTYTQTGSLMSAYFVGYGLGQIPWGILADKKGSRAIMSLSVLGVSFCTIFFGLAQTFRMALVSRFFAGLLGAGIFVPGVRLISDWFNTEERGTALGILNIGGSVGLIIASWVAPFLSLGIGWRLSIEMIGVIGALLACVIWLLLKDNKKDSNTSEEGGNLPINDYRFWILAFTQFIRLGSYYTYIAWLPLVLKEDYGFNILATSTALSLFNLAGIAANPLGGFLSDRYGEKPILMGSFLFLGFLLLGLTQFSQAIFIYSVIFLIGWFINFIRSPAFTIIPRIFGTESSGSISGIHNTFASLGALVLPFTLGYVKDYTLSYSIGWFFVLILSILTSGGVLILKIHPNKS
jgi:nitrate/nitrite transporter NarK